MSAHRPPLPHEAEHRLPHRAPRFGLALGHLANTPVVGAKRHPEHVGDDLLLDAAMLQFAGQVEKHLLGHVRQRGAYPARGSELRNEDHRLLHDGVDEQVGVHVS